jgi:hypothetical protein
MTLMPNTLSATRRLQTRKRGGADSEGSCGPIDRLGFLDAYAEILQGRPYDLDTDFAHRVASSGNGRPPDRRLQPMAAGAIMSRRG